MQTVKNIDTTNQPELLPIHRVKLWQGIFKPSSHFSTLRDAEKVTGLVWRVLLISLLAAIFTGLSSYLSMTLNILPAQAQEEVAGLANNPLFQNITVLFAAVGGFFGILLSMVIAAAILAIFFRDVPFGKQFAIQGYSSFIGLINMALSIPIMYLTKTLTPFFSLGIIGETLNAGPFLQSLLSAITVFFIWQVFFTITALKQTSNKPSKYVTSVVIILYVIYLLIGAAIASFGTAVSNIGV